MMKQEYIPVKRCCASSSALRFRPRLKQTIRLFMKWVKPPEAENKIIYEMGQDA